jgi:hypothetical protein
MRTSCRTTIHKSVCASQPVTEQPFDRIGTKLDLDPQVWIDLLKSLNDQRFSR